MVGSVVYKRISRRNIQIVLGLLWLLDGILQLQRQMFTSNFVTQVIAPAAQGQPKIVTGVMNFAIHIFLIHPAIFNTLIVIIQSGIGLLILSKRSIKLGLVLSVFWGLFVWYVGEGAGGVFSAHTLILMGAPGAALIYAILALGVMPRKENQEKQSAPAYWLVIVWLIFWMGGAVYQLLPGQNTTSDVSQMLYSNASAAPNWLASLDTHVAKTINGLGKHSASAQSPIRSPQMAGMNMNMSSPQMTQAPTQSGYWFILLMSFLMVCVGVGVLLPKIWRKIAISLGVILSLCFWVVGQSLGSYFSGFMTDPGSAPLFILLGISILAIPQLDLKIYSVYKRIENIIT